MRTSITTRRWFVLIGGFFLSAGATVSYAAESSLHIYPPTGLYPIGESFTVELRVSTGDSPVGTVDATVAFDTNDLEFVAVSDEGSVFSTILVDSTREQGRVDISGISMRGVPPFSGEDGLVARITFNALRNAATQVRIAGGSARSPLSLTAAVAQSTDMLTAIRSATYTLVPKDFTPPIATVAGAADSAFEITPLPVPVSDWFGTSSVQLSWTVPDGATAMRTGVSADESALPKDEYESAMTSVTTPPLAEGTSYFLLQFKYGDTWGDVIRHALKVDRTPPSAISIQETKRDQESDERTSFVIAATDEQSGMGTYEIGFDGGEFSPWERPEDGTYRPEGLEPGEHVLTVRAYDKAGNMLAKDHTFLVRSIDSPVLTQAPDHVLTGDVITVQGTTYPDADVTVFTSFNDGEPSEHTVRSDAAGAFKATVTDAARAGTYTVWFSVRDARGAVSPASIKRSIKATQPFVMLFGGYAVTYLSIIVPLLGLIVLLAIILWLAFVWVRGYRRRIRRETNEAFQVARDEFDSLRQELMRQIGMLEKANQSRELTKEEMRIFKELSLRLSHIEEHIEEEIDDIERVDVPDAGNQATVNHDTLGAYRAADEAQKLGIINPPKRNGAYAPAQPQGHTLRIERK